MNVPARRSGILLGVWLSVAGCGGPPAEPTGAAPSARAPATTEAPAPEAPPAPPRPFVIVESPEQPVARTPDGCTALEVNKTWHSLRYRRGTAPNCPTFADARPVLREMMLALQATGHLAGLTSFDMSRDYPAYFERLALAAARASAWDRARGKPKSGTANAFVVDTTRDAKAFFPEVVALLEGTGLTPELRSVEKVLVGPASETPFAPKLTAAGVAPTDQVPYDCIVAFHLSPSAK
jgi:hypothetical protein